MTSRWKGVPYFRRYGRELVSKPAISLKKSWGGAVERLLSFRRFGVKESVVQKTTWVKWCYLSREARQIENGVPDTRWAL